MDKTTSDTVKFGEENAEGTVSLQAEIKQDSEAKSTVPPDLSAMLLNMLNSPDAMAKISSVLSVLSNPSIANAPPPSEENTANTDSTPDTNSQNLKENSTPSPTFSNSELGDISQKLPELLSLLSAQKSRQNTASTQQISLLLAIKPYLSPRRRELIESFIQINRLGDVLKALS